MHRMRWERIRYAGRGVECSLCGGRFRSFAPDQWDGRRWHGARVRCPGCGSLPRHRLLWTYVQHARPGSLLHLAPEAVLGVRLAGLASDYVSADIEPGRADVVADITALPFEDDRFDLVVCSHVLEHVPDDSAAMRELERVLAPGGQALIQTPVNYDQPATYEDVTAADPADRLARFSQHDHVRVYGPDLRDRLEAAGFTVTIVDDGVLEHSSPLRNDLYVAQAV